MNTKIEKIFLSLIIMLALTVIINCGENNSNSKEIVLDDPPGYTNWPGGSVSEWSSQDGLEEYWAYGTKEPGTPPSEDTGYLSSPSTTDHAAPNANQLEGGEIDDNANFDSFLTFTDEVLADWHDDPMVLWIDVEQRHIITVKDREGHPVPDVQVKIYHDNQFIMSARTHSDGRIAFFPAAYEIQVNDFIAKGKIGDIQGEVNFRSNDVWIDLVLQGQDTPLTTCPLDIAFLIDTTGSMGEEIEGIKNTVSSIAARIEFDHEFSQIRMALVEYRDIFDEFVTHAINFTNNIGAFQRAINRLEAMGGDDMPESLNQALFNTMHRLAWNKERSLRLVFIIADAPAHYYENDLYTYDQAMRDAATMGVAFYPLASGGSDTIAELQFRQLAQFSLGHFLFITEGNGSSHGSGGSDYHVSPDDFVVQNLDEIIVRLINQEISQGCL